MSKVGLIGSARRSRRSWCRSRANTSSRLPDPELCGVEISDSGQQQGQGIHGSFGRQDTHNFMAAIGPDFKRGFVDTARSPTPTGPIRWRISWAYGFPTSGACGAG